METRDEIKSLLSNYVVKYPIEKENLERFFQFVNKHEGEQLYDRKNFEGHITASAFIVNAEGNSLLFLKHKALRLWLQPGGHVDYEDASLLSSALREAEEETGISAKDLVPLVDTVFDFDSHFIPENTHKQEAAHFHHDARFLLKCLQAVRVNIAEKESDDSKWISFAQLDNEDEFARVVKKIVSAR